MKPFRWLDIERLGLTLQFSFFFFEVHFPPLFVIDVCGREEERTRSNISKKQ